jgi:hypothetical protein
MVQNSAINPRGRLMGGNLAVEFSGTQAIRLWLGVHSALNQLDLVPFRRIDERDRAALGIRMRTV